MFSRPAILSFLFFTQSLAAVSGIQGVLDVPFQKQTSSAGHSGPVEARDLSELLQNENRLYYAFNYTYGTPPQKLSGQLDTGSSDVIIFSNSYPAAGDAPTYNNESSSTYHYLKSGFKIRYGDYSYAEGDYITDDFTFGGAQVVKDVIGAYAVQGNVSQAVFGIGYPGNEAGSYGNTPYINFPAQLKSQGFIEANAYSLYLNSELSSDGGVLFGGVDSAKYTPPLVTLPLVSINDQGKTTSSPVAFFVDVKGISVEGENVTDANIGSALLDSGTTASILDGNFVSEVADLLGFFNFALFGGTNYISLSPPTKNITLEYKFSENLTIKVPVSQIYRDLGGVYQLLLAPRPDGLTFDILGDSFLSSAYVVYDLDNNEVSLAQAIWNENNSDIKKIPAGPGAVPGAVAAT